MNSVEIVDQFVKCQTEMRNERTYYIYMECKNQLIKDINYTIIYNKKLAMFASFSLALLAFLIYINVVFKLFGYCIKKIFNLSLYLVDYKEYYNDDKHDRLHKLENMIENINMESLYLVDNDRFNKLENMIENINMDSNVKQKSYNRELLNIKDRLTILENDILENDIEEHGQGMEALHK